MSTFVIWNGVFFVVFANAALGVSRVQPSLAQSVRTMGGGRWEILRTVILPGALPDMLTGVRVGLSFAWRSLIAAELLGAPEGLGQWINRAALNQRSEQILAGCITVAVLGRPPRTRARVADRLPHRGQVGNDHRREQEERSMNRRMALARIAFGVLLLALL